jgi:ribonuclease BN (tRNA processing enzyme)
MNNEVAVARDSLGVCGNTAAMLSATRYAPRFQVSGDKTRRFGLFDCGPGTAKVATLGGEAPCC